MAISSEALRQRFLSQILNQAAPRNAAEGISSLGTSLANVIASRRQVPAAQKREADLAARATADKIGQEVGLRDALISSGFDPAQAGGIASARPGIQGALIGLQPPEPTALQTEQLAGIREDRATTRRQNERQERQFQAGKDLAGRVLQGEFGDLDDAQRLNALSASVTGDIKGLGDIIQSSDREFDIVGNKDQGLFRFNKQTGELDEVVPAASGALSKPQQAELTQKLRKEAAAIPAVKSYRKALPPVKSAIQSATVDTKAADLDIIFAVMKAVDPESVVRESEQAVAFKAGSPAQRFQGLFNEVTGGGRLTLQQRQDLLNVAVNRMTAFRESAVSDLEQFQGIADAAEVDQQLAIPRLEPLPETQFVQSGGEAQGAIPPRPSAGGGGQPTVMRFDAQGNLVQ